MVGKIDPLARVRTTTSPAHVRSADQLYQGYDKANHLVCMIWAILRQRRKIVSMHPATIRAKAAGRIFAASGHKGAKAANRLAPVITAIRCGFAIGPMKC